MVYRVSSSYYIYVLYPWTPTFSPISRHEAGNRSNSFVLLCRSVIPRSLLLHLFAQGHSFQLVQQSPPVIRQQLSILDPFLCPILVPPRNVVLRALEGDELVADALLDKYGVVVLLHDRFLVLRREGE